MFGCSKHKNKDKIFTDLKNIRYNILDINYTNFTYENKKIYQFNDIGLGNEYFFFNNYLLVDNLKVYTIFTIPRIREKEYNSFKYLFSDDQNIDTNEVADIKNLIMDFGLKVNDTLNKRPGEVILINKQYDVNINDTVYVFSRKFVWNHDITNLVATKKFGIIGFYDYYYNDKVHKEVCRNYGWTNLWTLDSTYTMSNDRRKEPYKIKKPSLNLNKIKFLKRDN